MFDPKKLDEFAKRFTEAVPERLKHFKGDLDKAFRNSMQSAFAKLDLVTREEFEVQAEVLAKTRAKVEELQKQVQILEKHIKGENTTIKSKNKSTTSKIAKDSEEN